MRDKPAIVVLPFANMSGDPEQEFFADGLTEDVITELSRFRDLLVISRNTSTRYKGKAVEVKKIARELAVHYLLEGSVRKAGQPRARHRAADRRRRPIGISGPIATTGISRTSSPSRTR